MLDDTNTYVSGLACLPAHNRERGQRGGLGRGGPYHPVGPSPGAGPSPTRVAVPAGARVVCRQQPRAGGQRSQVCTGAPADRARRWGCASPGWRAAWDMAGACVWALAVLCGRLPHCWQQRSVACVLRHRPVCRRACWQSPQGHRQHSCQAAAQVWRTGALGVVGVIRIPRTCCKPPADCRALLHPLRPHSSPTVRVHRACACAQSSSLQAAAHPSFAVTLQVEVVEGGAAAAGPGGRVGRLAAIDALLAAMRQRLRKVEARIKQVGGDLVEGSSGHGWKCQPEVCAPCWPCCACELARCSMGRLQQRSDWPACPPQDIGAAFELVGEEGPPAGTNTAVAPTPVPGPSSASDEAHAGRLSSQGPSAGRLSSFGQSSASRLSHLGHSVDRMPSRGHGTAAASSVPVAAQVV